MNKKIRETLDYYQDTEFDKTMKDIKDNLIARINRQEKEIERLRTELAKIPRYKMEYELEIDKLKNELEELEKNHDFRVDQAHNLQKRIDKAIEYIKALGVIPKNIDIFVLLEILERSDKE